MITVITTPTCVWCNKVKKLLNDNNIPFQEWRPTSDEIRPLFHKLELSTVPQVFLDDPRHNEHAKLVGGYNQTFQAVNRGELTA